MQAVSWNQSLSPFVQHEDFYLVAQEIKQDSDQYALLYNKAQSAGHLVMRDNLELQWRARTRNSWFRTPDLIQNRAQSEDYAYQSRDANRSERGDRVYKTATLLRTCPQERNVHPDILEDILRWPSVSGFGDEYLPKSFQKIQSVSLNDVWGSLYEVCRLQSPEGNWTLSFLLTQFAYKDTDILEHIETFVAISCSARFQDMLPPSNRSYEISVGVTPSTDSLDSAIRAHRQAFKWVAPKGVSKAARDSKHNASREEHRQLVEEQLEKLRGNLASQWPEGPIAPAGVRFPNISVASAVASCATIFSRATQTKELDRYVQQIQDQLNQILSPEDEVAMPVWPELETMPTSRPTQVCPDLLTILTSALAPSLPRLKPRLVFKFETTLPDTSQLEVVLSPYFTQQVGLSILVHFTALLFSNRVLKETSVFINFWQFHCSK